MAYALLQSRQQTGGGALTTVRAYASNVTANNLLICAVSSGGPNSQATGITDSQANTWSQVGTASISALGDAIQIFYTIAGSSAANTVTVTFPGVAQGDTMTIFEYSGNATSSVLDQINVGQGVSSTPASASITPGQANCLVFAAEVDGAIDGTTITAGTNYTIRQTQLTSSVLERIGTEDWIQTTATATTGNFTLGTSATWATKVAAFKPLVVAVASGSPTIMMMGV